MSDKKQERVTEEKNDVEKSHTFKEKTSGIIKKIEKFITKYSVLPFLAIGIALFFLTLILTAQIKSINDTESIIAGKRESQLADDLITLQRKYDDLKLKHEENSKIVEEYQTSASTNDSLIASMKKQLNEYKLLSGASDLKGEGIVITLDDGTKIIDPEYRADALVHAEDVLTVVNELKAAGAEAISVNGQRIISTTAIRCVGPVIQINYQKVGSPFEIKAIGNAQYLESAMNIKGGVPDMLRQYGVEIKIARQNEIKIPKYDGTQKLDKAQPDEKKQGVAK